MRKSPSIYESIKDLQTEQHANLNFSKKAEAGVLKSTKRSMYEEMDEKLHILVSSFSACTRQDYFKKREHYLIFKFLNKIPEKCIFIHYFFDN